VTAVSAAYHHTLALLADGTVRAWGLNDQGQLGDGSTADRLTPVQVTGLRGVTKIAANGGGDVDKPGDFGHSMAVLRDGTARAWGVNDKGQLGDGSTVNRTTPVRVEGLRGIADIEAGVRSRPRGPGRPVATALPSRVPARCAPGATTFSDSSATARRPPPARRPARWPATSATSTRSTPAAVTPGAGRRRALGVGP